MTNKTLQSDILTFIASYGEAALQEAMQQYIDGKQEYICKNRSYTVKIRIRDISYIKIEGHNITIHTSQGMYEKYGTLGAELNLLSSHGFLKCNQSCIVSLDKIKAIQNNDILMMDDTVLHISRSCAPKILAVFHGKSRNAKS